ncbi:MAG: HAD hydrolase family protein [Myxococcota bacterium]
MNDFSTIKLLAFDIDGTLTDGTTWWGGDDLGWLQRYSERDAEALSRLKSQLHVVPLSDNETQSARERMTALGLDARWVGVTDKLAALRQICAEHVVHVDDVCFVGDGLDDVDVLKAVKVGCAVADAHILALEAADLILEAAGGDRVLEELEGYFR